MFNKRRLLTVGVCSVLSVIASAATAQTLRVGTNAITPFGGPPPGGGYCVDLMGEIAERTGMQFEFSFLPVPDFAPSLTGNTIDILCSGVGPTNELRAMGIAFTSAIFTNYDGLIVLATDATPYTTAADFRGQPVTALAGTVYAGIWTNAGVDNLMTTTGATGAADMYAMLRSGQVKAAIVAAPAFFYQQQALDIADGLRLVETYAPVVTNYPALAVRSTETALLGTLQAALEALKADGTLDVILERWAMPAPPF
ncbi:MAG: amino acid ABC transporter substrate-binding protein [Bauldia sp.]|nr:amino acid ABC transporter substrate-binding protein [Bauldia sp.]